MELENDGATILAANGYQTQQNPTAEQIAQARLATGDVGGPGSRPDYIVEGRVFECYSPKAAKPPRGIHGEVVDKVVLREQTQRIVLNLTDWEGDMAALRKQFYDWPIEGLKEVKAITPDGDIVQIDLPPPR
ncbi:hypothetical protein [Actinoplanes sp. NPDC026619]|uniref:CdiA C-terminal domain-containing protein n=1 Tax=Actinoplanes sp. NPDC026619 TaxID=3155798 RepID=UPI00340851FE